MASVSSMDVRFQLYRGIYLSIVDGISRTDGILHIFHAFTLHINGDISNKRVVWVASFLSLGLLFAVVERRQRQC